MDSNLISSRAVLGMYYAALEQPPATWIDGVSNFFNSNQASEEYAMLGQVPSFREWIGGRQAKTLRSDSFTIANKHWETTLDILLTDLRRDKTGQLRARMGELAQRAQNNYAKLLTTLIVNGESSTCYDGQYFFDTDHSEGLSGTQSNDITTDISALPASLHGTATAPSPEEMQQAILESISKMLTFVDDQGEPINETASSFLVMLPIGLANAARSGLSMARVAGTGTFSMDGFSITPVVNTRLTSSGWTDKFVTFRTDGFIKPLIRQEETVPQVKMKDEMSEYAFDNDAIQIGIDAWHNVGYGRWQGAVLNQLV